MPDAWEYFQAFNFKHFDFKTLFVRSQTVYSIFFCFVFIWFAHMHTRLYTVRRSSIKTYLKILRLVTVINAFLILTEPKAVDGFVARAVRLEWNGNLAKWFIHIQILLGDCKFMVKHLSAFSENRKIWSDLRPKTNFSRVSNGRRQRTRLNEHHRPVHVSCTHDAIMRNRSWERQRWAPAGFV